MIITISNYNQGKFNIFRNISHLKYLSIQRPRRTRRKYVFGNLTNRAIATAIRVYTNDPGSVACALIRHLNAQNTQKPTEITIYFT